MNRKRMQVGKKLIKTYYSAITSSSPGKNLDIYRKTLEQRKYE